MAFAAIPIPAFCSEVNDDIVDSSEQAEDQSRASALVLPTTLTLCPLSSNFPGRRSKHNSNNRTSTPPPLSPVSPATLRVFSPLSLGEYDCGDMSQTSRRRGKGKRLFRAAPRDASESNGMLHAAAAAERVDALLSNFGHAFARRILQHWRLERSSPTQESEETASVKPRWRKRALKRTRECPARGSNARDPRHRRRRAAEGPRSLSLLDLKKKKKNSTPPLVAGASSQLTPALSHRTARTLFT